MRCDVTTCLSEGVRIEYNEWKQPCQMTCLVCGHVDTDIGILHARLMMDYVRKVKANRLRITNV